MAHKEIPVLLITGYLGSGKTTLLNHILNGTHGIRFAVIVNDLGEVNIDAELIAKGGIVGGNDASGKDLVALQNGCICCTLQMDLVEQLSELAQSGKFDYIVIEASGICEPEPIARTIAMMPRMDPKYTHRATPRVDCVCTVVDALRMRDEFGCGDALTKPGLDEEDIENLVIQQIEFCNVIILNKISEVSPAEAKRVKDVIRALQSKAKIIETDYCDVNLDEITGTGMFNFEDTATSATWVREIEKPLDELDDHDHDHGHHHHDHCHCHNHEHGEADEYGVQTFVYYRRPGFDMNKFDYFVNKKWPKSVIRAKGVVYFNHNRDMSYLFEQAGTQKKLTEAGYWYATAPEHDLKLFMERDPGLKRDWDETYGDRMIKLVIIGRNMDRDEITALLDDC